MEERDEMYNIHFLCGKWNRSVSRGLLQIFHLGNDYADSI